MRQCAQADTAYAELAVVGSWTPTEIAAVIAASLELGLTLTLFN